MKQLATAFLVLACTWFVAGCGGGGFQSTQTKATTSTSAPSPSGSNDSTTTSGAKGVQVTLQSPAPAGSVVSVQASASSPNAISGWVVYSDDTPVYQNNGGNTISAQVSLPSGQHTMYARAWDSSGAFGTSAAQQVQVGTGSASAQPAAPAESSALPTPPANAVVLDNIQNEQDGWKACSDCAYGKNQTTNFWMGPYTTNPSMSGSSRELFVGGSQWTNALFTKTLPAHNEVSHFLWDFWVYFDPTSNANIWSAEFDLWQSVGGEQFMIGSQCNFGNGEWDVWDATSNKWVPTDKACQRWAPATWHHVQWYMERTGNAYHYGTVVVDGQATVFNRTYSAIHNGWDDAVGVQWQLDQSSTGVPIHEWIDKVKLSAW